MSPRILIVEDEWLIADLLETMVSELGYEVVGPASCVADALALIQDQPPDAGLLDVSLGETKSFSVADAMTECGAPFLFLTGYVEADLPAAYRSRPILCKPVSLSQLQGPLERMAPMGLA